MKVFLTNENYKTMMKCMAVWGWVYWIMSDMVDEKYKIDYDKIEELKNHILWFYKDFWIDKNQIEIFDKKYHLSGEYMKNIVDDMQNFWEMEFWDQLSHRLSLKELENKYWKEELEKMSRDDFLSKLFEVEARFEKEFDDNWLKNIKFKNNPLCA
jgi:hypothetical protein